MENKYIEKARQKQRLTEEFFECLKEEMGEDKAEVEFKRLSVSALCMQTSFSPFDQFFDHDSDKLLDEKIEVLTALNEGKYIADIPNFYDILELYPGNETHWD